jgi:DNA-binding SARP family transcriptional activator
MADRLEFCLLGPLTVRCDGVAVPPLPGKQRALLAVLLLRAGQPVTTDQLAELLWAPAAPPASATFTVRNYVKRLRQALGAAGRDRLLTQPGGYLIRVADGELDITRMEQALTAARRAFRDGDWRQASRHAAAAIDLWQGEPLCDVALPILGEQEVRRLTELRLQAHELRFEANLKLARHAEVVSRVAQLARDHPLRENLQALLMLALYRCGRRAEALEAYRQSRDVLVQEVGSEPGPELQALHRQILRDDPALAPPPPPLPARHAGDPVGARGQDAPRQLPAAVRCFAGREAELATLTGLATAQAELAPTVLITAIGGTAGVGKTALAVRWAHQVADRFGDGQLYVNLRGYDPGQPVTAAEALAGFLRSLGVPGPSIPAGEDERAARYRSLLAGRQMLIVLDNARSVEQVRPLLPGTPTCAVVVTSRDSLAGLVARDGAVRLDLDLLPLADAVALLRELIGGRVDAESDAAETLAQQCARLPLALRVAAELAAARPHIPLASLVTQLAGERHRLDLLQAGRDPATSVRAVFSWSTGQLGAEAARMFRLLGLHPGPDISVPAAASLAGIAEGDARRLLGELARAFLVAEHVAGRYAFHDLLRAYAADQAYDNDTDRREAVGRVLDHYLHTAARAALQLVPSKEPVVLGPPRPGATTGQPADYAQAMAWFEAEHQVLLAEVGVADNSGFDAHAWQLPWAMADFQLRRGYWEEQVAVQRTALAAATRLGDTAAQALSGRLLGVACAELGDHDQARSHFAGSLRLYQQLGDCLGEAKIHHNLGGLAERQGRYADALGHAKKALRLFQAIGDRRSEAVALNSAGWCHGLLGEYQQAREFCRQAVTVCAETGDLWTEGFSWDSLGYAEHQLGNLAEAAGCYQRAVDLLRETGDRFQEAHTLICLGDTYDAAGELAQARQGWQLALAILEDLQHPDADQVRAKLASTSDHDSETPSA